MQRKIIFIVALIITLPIAWWLVSPLFLNKKVDEPFPFQKNDSAENEAGIVSEDRESPNVTDRVSEAFNDLIAEFEVAQAAGLSDEERVAFEKDMLDIAAQMPDHIMDELMPATSDEWQVIATGDFRGADSFHQGSGTATVYAQGDEQVLRFENFASTNGPDLHVLLVENISGTRHGDLGDYVNLGSLKGNKGSQNYSIPAGIDISEYEGVLIYCKPFHVVFATSRLE